MMMTAQYAMNQQQLSSIVNDINAMNMIVHNNQPTFQQRQAQPQPQQQHRQMSNGHMNNGQ